MKCDGIFCLHVSSNPGLARPVQTTWSKSTRDFASEIVLVNLSNHTCTKTFDVAGVGSGVTRSSWRITVRQLESMIRLSEAMAKMSCSDEVLPKHVQEAFRLLNKSIIRVETPDIDFEEDEVVPPPEAGEEESMAVDQDASQSQDGNDEATATQRKKDVKPLVSVVRVQYEEYKKIANLLIIYLRQLEDGGGH